MKILKRLFGGHRSEKWVPEEDIHGGHVAALGARAATMLSQVGARHAAMNREHLRWSPRDGGFRVIGWGHARMLNWPGDVRLHTADIRVFHEAHGPFMTAHLRLGYVYQLGPIGEWIFYRALGEDQGTDTATAPPSLLEQWAPPPPDMALGEDAELPRRDVARVTNAGIRHLQDGNRVAAKRAFLRCLIMGLAVGDPGIEFASVTNLVTVFLDEQRFLRAYGLATMAIPSAGDNETHTDFLARLMAGMRSMVPPEDQRELFALISDESCTCLAEAMWRCDDLETSRLIQTMEEA